jgi:hypothetical protein
MLIERKQGKTRTHIINIKTRFVGALLTVFTNLTLTQFFYGLKNDITELSSQNFGPAIF